MHLDPQLWTFGFDNAKRRAGLCNYTDHKITVSRYLSEKFEDDEIHQVLLHEVAHAIAGAIFHDAIIRGKFHGLIAGTTPAGPYSLHVWCPESIG